MNIFFNDFKKIFVIVLMLLFIFLSVFFFAFLALFTLPVIILFFILKRFLNTKNKYSSHKTSNTYYKNENDKFIDVDYKKNEEKDT